MTRPRADAAASVAINARAAVRGEIGGVERYARELTRWLTALRPDRYRVLHPPRALAHRAGHVWEQAALPLMARSDALLYSPANLAPLLGSARNVVVIHDAAALRHPEAYSRQFVAYQRRLLPALAARARLVITVSEFSRRELIELLGLAPERIRIIPGGVDERFTPAADPIPVRDRYALRGPYVLVVGTASARKNLSALDPAALALRERGIELVMAGSERGYLRGEPPALRRLGYVADDDLPGLYAGALALAMPSRHEGFGLPCLEAMASGVPVVAANAGALPETVGDAALLAHPAQPRQFADAVLTAALDQTARGRLIEAGVVRARAFAWSRAARLTDELIGELLEQR